MPNPTQRLEWIDVARGASIFLVVLYHVTLFMSLSGYQVRFIEVFNSAVGPIRMPLFFLVSGMLSASMIKKPWEEILGERVWKFVYLFFLWSLITWAYQYFLLSPLLGATAPTLQTLLLAWLEPLSTLWFIWGLAVYTVVTKALNRYRGVALVGSLLTFYLSLHYLDDLQFSQASILRYLIFFQLGVWFKKEILASFDNQRRTWVFGGLLFFVLGAVIRLVDEGSVAYSGLRLLMSLSGVALAFVICRDVLACSKLLSGIFNYIGQRTLPIYVLHTLLAWPIIVANASALATLIAGLATILAFSISVFVIIASLLLRSAIDTAHLSWLFEEPRAGRIARNAN